MYTSVNDWGVFRGWGQGRTTRDGTKGLGNGHT